MWYIYNELIQCSNKTKYENEKVYNRMCQRENAQQKYDFELVSIVTMHRKPKKKPPSVSCTKISINFELKRTRDEKGICIMHSDEQ